ncbi:MAG: glycosyltransferase family 4 protein [Candidatus Helarchaeota archaeon]
MKVYLISIQYVPNITGGGGVVVKELSRELVEAGDNVVVLTIGIGSKDKSEEIINLIDDTGTYPVKVKRFFVSDSKDISNPYEGSKTDEFRRFEELTEQIFEYVKDKEGIIHLHGHYIIPALAKRIKEEGKKNPTLISFHALESIALKAKKIKDNYALNYIKEREEIGLKYADYSIVNSENVKNQLKEMYPDTFSDQKVIVIPNYVSNELIHTKITSNEDVLTLRRKYDLWEDSQILFHVGRIDKIKGIEFLIESMKIVSPQIKSKITVVIAGFLEEKQKKYFKLLTDLADDIMKKCPNIQVKFIPNMDASDKIYFFDACFFFISPAILEPFGLTTLEAWARGKPVIRSDNEGSRYLFDLKGKIAEPFEKKEAGIIVNFDSNRAEHLAAAILELVNNPEEARKMGELGKKIVYEKYSWKNTIKIYRDLYQKASKK